jgi:hypothetical protein
MKLDPNYEENHAHAARAWIDSGKRPRVSNLGDGYRALRDATPLPPADPAKRDRDRRAHRTAMQRAYKVTRVKFEPKVGDRYFPHQGLREMLRRKGWRETGQRKDG